MGNGCCGGHGHGNGHRYNETNYDEMTGMMAHLADKAWMQLMTEKMRAAWEEERGKYMTAMAKVAVEHSMMAWKKKMESKEMDCEPSKEEIEDFKKKLHEAMK